MQSAETLVDRQRLPAICSCNEPHQKGTAMSTWKARPASNPMIPITWQTCIVQLSIARGAASEDVP
jgi:hypothetical protein